MNNHDWQHNYDSAFTEQNERNDFFEVVPPTPFDFSHGPFLHVQSQTESDLDAHAHHLRPSPFRNHRSSSSGSISSQISGFSGTTNNTQWGSDTDHSDLAAQLSVDPKLFQARIKTPTPEPERIEVLVETASAPVAVPVKGKKRQRTASQKEREKEKEDRKKISHARKAQQHPEHIPRPRNAFILFRKHVVDSKLIPTSVEIRHQNVSIITAKMWSEASAEQKAHFAELARIEKEEHLIKYPGYRYQPVYRRTNVVRRRVRKDAAEEEKCKSVAQLLMQGKTGEELAEEIKETGTQNAGKLSRTPSKKGQANELSKGALRALRAQARQGDSAEGSEMSISRSVSRAVTPEANIEDEDSGDESQSPEPVPLYMSEPIGQPAFVPDQMYGHAQDQPTMSWGYEQPIPQEQYLQGYRHSHQQSMQYEGHMPQQAYHHEMLYPTPIQQLSYEALPEFYTHDQALPFSPSTGSFPLVHPQPGQTVYRGLREGVNDMIFSTFPDGLQSPSMAYLSQNVAPSRPMSARWGGFEMGDGAFELGINGSDLMLNEYGSALAQVDDTSVW